MQDPASHGWPLDLDHYARAMERGRVLSRYFRPEHRGFEVFRRPGGLLTVSNHGLFALESASLAIGLWDAARRPLRGLGDRVLYATAAQRRMLGRVGGVEGTPENAHLLLTRGEVCWACPGGAREALAPARDRYRLFWGGHHGFVRAALRARVPIVPLAVVGSDELYRQLLDADGVRATLFGKLVTRTLGDKYVTPLYMGLGPLPLPMKLYFLAGEPLEPPADVSHEDEAGVRAWHAEVTAREEELVARALGWRREDQAAMPPGAERTLTGWLRRATAQVDAI